MSPEQAAQVVQGSGNPAEESALLQSMGVVSDTVMGRDDFTAVAKLGGCGSVGLNFFIKERMRTACVLPFQGVNSTHQIN